MGRNRKQGLDYYPLDVDFFSDIKIRKLIRRQSGQAVTVYTLLLCLVYKNGYYLEWDDDLPFIISEQTGFDEQYISEVISTCVDLRLFHSETFQTASILTSRAIQERYQSICQANRRLGEITRFNLLDAPEEQIAPPPHLRPKQPKQKAEPKTKKLKAETKTKETKAKPKETKAPSESELYTLMRNDEQWAVQMAMRHNIPIEDVTERINAFQLDCACRDKSHTDLADAKRHYNDWLRIQLQQQAKTPKKSEENKKAEKELKQQQEKKDQEKEREREALAYYRTLQKQGKAPEIQNEQQWQQFAVTYQQRKIP